MVKLFGIDPSNDDAVVHPQSFCYTCYKTADRIKKGNSTKRVTPECLPHNDVMCDVCDLKCSCGRPKKKKSCGRPTALTHHIQSVACAIPEKDITQTVSHRNSYLTNYTCGFCKRFVVQPVEIEPCKSLACSSCCIDACGQLPVFTCAGCSVEHTTVISSFSRLSPIAIKVLNELLVKCTKCHYEVPLLMISSDCKNHSQLAKVPTIDDIIHQPLEAEPTQFETRAVSNVMSRIIYHQNESTKVITLPRKGTVSICKLIL